MPPDDKTVSDLDARALDLIGRSDELRRELLWLRAMEKRDRRSARELELVDPELRARVADVRRRAEALDPRGAAEAYGAAYDERFEEALASVERLVKG